jgi:AcrR family transcriptional regulator
VKTAVTSPKRSVPKKPREAYHHGDLARALVEGALELIAKSGAESFTLRELARVVGVNHASVYRHFEDKRALFAAVAEEAFRALATETRVVLARTEGDALVRLAALARTYVAFALAHPSHFRIMSGPRLNEDGRFPTLEEAIDAAAQPFFDEVRRGQEAGVIRDAKPRDLMVTLWTFAHGYAGLVSDRRIRVKSREVALGYFSSLLVPVLDGLRKPT